MSSSGDSARFEPESVDGPHSGEVSAHGARAPQQELDAEQIGRTFREGSGRAVAALIRLFGDIEVAEDAVQDAFALALKSWVKDGLPSNPSAWILTTGRNRAIDRLRRESLGRAILGDLVREQSLASGEVDDELDPLSDDQLRLIFTCCHPALASEAQVALTLRLIGGLPTREVARSFLVEEATMAQRLVRAKRKIKSEHIPYRVPSESELPTRLPPVLAVAYLIYNAGSGRAPASGVEDRCAGGAEDLCAEGIRLARLLHALMPEEPEVTGLLSLLLLNESRRGARFAADGSLISLREQAREGWNPQLILEGQELLRACLRRDEPGPYQLQAAIQAVHADAARIEDTDWAQIVAIYDELLHMTGTPVVAMNRAIAVAEVDGPAAALTLLEELELDSYYSFHATRADLLRRLERLDEAKLAYRRAAELAPTEAEREFLKARAN